MLTYIFDLWFRVYASLAPDAILADNLAHVQTKLRHFKTREPSAQVLAIYRRSLITLRREIRKRRHERVRSARFAIMQRLFWARESKGLRCIGSCCEGRGVRL